MWWTRNPKVLAGEVRSLKAAGFRVHRQLSTQSGLLDQVAARVGQRLLGHNTPGTIDDSARSVDRSARAHAKDGSPRALYQHFRVRVVSSDRPSSQRIQVSNVHPPRMWWNYLAVQDADYLIRQLQRAIKRAPRAR